MLKEIILFLIRTHGRVVKAEQAVIVFSRVSDDIFPRILGTMTFKCLTGHIKTGFPVKGSQRLTPVHDNRVLLIQMDVHFPDLPRIQRGIFPGQFIRRIRCQFQGPNQSPGTGFMCPMPVFSVKVMRHRHQRPVSPDYPGNKLQDVLLTPHLDNVPRLGGIPVDKDISSGHDGIFPHAAGPEAVQQLTLSAGRLFGDIDHKNFFPAFPPVIWNGSAKPEDLVIRMGGKDQQIRLPFKRLPPLYPVRNTSGTQELDLCHAEIHGTAVVNPKMTQIIYRNVLVVIQSLPCSPRRLPCTLTVLHLQLVGGEFSAPLDIQAEAVLSLRQFKFQPAVWSPVPRGLIPVIREPVPVIPVPVYMNPGKPGNIRRRCTALFNCFNEAFRKSVIWLKLFILRRLIKNPVR